MNDFPDIINTGIIPDAWNDLWAAPVELANLPPKPILILTTRYHIASPEEVQLQKMMEACKITSEAYNIIQINENQIINTLNQTNSSNIKTIILLGILPYQLGISAQFVLNAPNRFAGRVFIPALSLSAMEQQPDMKKQLWNNALKPVFIENK